MMSGNTISILSTKPLDDSFINKASRDNITIDNASFISIRKILSVEDASIIRKLGDQKINVVFTSLNAVEIVVQALDRPAGNMPQWDIYCLGGASFTEIKKFWVYDRIKGSGKNATELAQKIIADKLEVVHFFCGNSRREELPALLFEANITINEYPVYATELTPVAVSKAYNGILFFSPSGVESFFRLNTLPAETVLFAIGQTTANTINKFTNNKVICSPFPAKEQLLESVIDHYNCNNQFIK